MKPAPLIIAPGRRQAGAIAQRQSPRLQPRNEDRRCKGLRGRKRQDLETQAEQVLPEPPRIAAASRDSSQRLRQVDDKYATTLYTLCDPFAARFAVGHREDGGGVDDELELHLAAPLPGGLSPSLLDRAKLLPAVTADGNWTAKSDGSVPRRAKLEGVTVIQLRPRGPRSA